LGIGKQ